jgi:hypothetical protein
MAAVPQAARFRKLSGWQLIFPHLGRTIFRLCTNRWYIDRDRLAEAG